MMKRRDVLRHFGAAGGAAALAQLAPAYAWAATRRPGAVPDSTGAIDLAIAEFPFTVRGRTGTAVGINGSVPGPLVRLREGQEAILRVRNGLDTSSSVHWHGVLVPNPMDGVPGVAFPGIAPHTTFEARFPVIQSGTYWYHSHSGGQEQRGLYGPIIIDPREPDPVKYDREYVVLLSDWSFVTDSAMIANLKRVPSYYNYQQPTLADLRREAAREGWDEAVDVRLAWDKMRMDPTDFADVSGAAYTYLINGLPPDANWYALHEPGERVRLRFISGGAMSIFDVRIPGLPMTIVQADGKDVKPVTVDEFRIGPGETYDVIVEPQDRAYTLFAEPMDRSGYARATLAPRPGMSAPIPSRGPRPMLSMSDMGMDMNKMNMSGSTSMKGMSMPEPQPTSAPASMDSMNMSGSASVKGMSESGPPKPPNAPASMRAMDMTGSASMKGMSMPQSQPSKPIAQASTRTMDMSGLTAAPTSNVLAPSLPHSKAIADTQGKTGPENSMVPMTVRNRLDDPGPGLEHTGHRVLVYTDLQSTRPAVDTREPSRSIEIRLTGNMDSYIWGFDGKKYTESPTIAFHYGERLRLFLINETMMEHPIHLHGMYMELENGDGTTRPLKHTIRVRPAERLSVLITADAPGRWAMHCHLEMHMMMGMFRVVEVA